MSAPADRPFWALLFLYLVPLFAVDWIPMQDLPNHMDNGGLLLRLSDSSHTVVDDYYHLVTAPVPNLASTVLPAIFLFFLPLELAQRALVLCLVLGLALATRFAVGSFRPDDRGMAILVLPLVYSFIFQLGFIGFLYGLVLYLFLIGLWVRWWDRWTPLRILAFVPLAILTFLAHAVPLIVLFVTLFVLSFHRAVARSSPSVLLPLLTFAPALGMVAWFTRSPIFEQPVMIPQTAFRPTDLALVYCFDGREAWVSLAILVLFAGLAAHGTSRRAERPDEASDGLWMAFFAMVAMYGLARDPMGEGSFLKPRLVLFPFLVLILAVAARPAAGWMRRGIPAAVLALALLHLPLVLTQYRAHDRALREIISLRDSIEEGSTVLPLCFYSWREDSEGRPGSSRIQAYLHAGAWLSADRDVVNLRNYSAPFWQFPVRYLPERDPYRYLSPAEKDFQYHSRMNFTTYAERTGSKIDYVVLWGLEPDQEAHPGIRSLVNTVAAGWDLIRVSPGGRARLYRAKVDDPAGGGV